MKSLLVNSDLCSFEGAGRGEREKRRVRKAEAESEAKRTGSDGKRPKGKVSGDDSWRAPPVPIPNTEVKPPNADGTELGTAWESRKLPGSTREREERKFFPLPNITGESQRQAKTAKGRQRQPNTSRESQTKGTGE